VLFRLYFAAQLLQSTANKNIRLTMDGVKEALLSLFITTREK
jgi:hypothetical protein